MKELETRWEDLGEFIREQRQVGRISLRKLSEMAGISNPYLSQIERGLRKPSAEILQQIAKALQLSAETLYIRAGILEEREGDENVAVALLRDPHLNEEQRQTLLRVYESFVRDSKPTPTPEPASEAMTVPPATTAPIGTTKRAATPTRTRPRTSPGRAQKAALSEPD